MKTTVFFTAALLIQLQVAEAQEVKVPEIGGKAPSFTAMSTSGEVSFPDDFGKHWKIIFSHPKDFTPVCSSELLELAHAQKDFEKLNTSLLVVSTDILGQHESWKAALEGVNYMDRRPAKIHFPLVADDDHEVSRKYGMLQTQNSVSQNIKGVYIIDPENTIRLIQFYPNELGRNVEELKRALVALQTVHDSPDHATPANWQPGDDLIVPVLTNEEKENIGMPGSVHYQYSWFLVFEKMR